MWPSAGLGSPLRRGVALLRPGPGYNAQAVTNEHQIVVAAELMFGSPDFGYLEPMVDAAIRELEQADHDRRIFPSIFVIFTGYWLYEALAVRARRRRLGFDPDLYLAVERRVSEEDLRPELLVHHPSEQSEYSGWYVYASEQDQGSSDLVPWSMRDLLDHSPEAADPLREGHGKWRWDRARNAYSLVG